MALASETEEGWVGLEEITRISTGPATAIEDLTGIFLDVDASTSPYGGVEAGSNTWDLTSTMIPGASLYNPLWEGFHFPLGGGEEVEGGNVSGDVPLPPLGLGLPFDEALEAANAEDAAQMGSITATPLLTTLLDPFDALAYGFHFDDLAAAPVEQPSDLSAPAEISFDAAAWDAAIRATNLGEGLVDELESEEVVVVRGTKRSRVEMVAEEAVVLSGGSGLGRPMEEEEEVIPCPRARALSPPPPSKVSLPALVGEVAPQLIPSRAIIPSTKPPHRLARAGEKRPREEDKAERREVEEERRVRTRRLLVERNGALAAQRDVAPWVRAERARNKCSKRRMAKLGWEADQEVSTTYFLFILLPSNPLLREKQIANTSLFTNIDPRGRRRADGHGGIRTLVPGASRERTSGCPSVRDCRSRLTPSRGTRLTPNTTCRPCASSVG